VPTILTPPYQPEFAGHPPRMSAEDFPIWERYYPTIKPSVTRLYFDVGLGLPDELPITEDGNQMLGWIRNTQKRADVIALTNSAALLIELRFNAQMNAIGRLYGYRRLLEQDNPFNVPVRAILVTNRGDNEVRDAASSLGIDYVVS
jgi:hypothetical protein